MNDEQTSIADLISHALVGISTAQRLLTAARPRAGADAVELDSLRDEVAALREIIAGRTTAPTDAEIEAHAEAGGSWLTGDTVTWAPGSLRAMRDGGEVAANSCSWIPLDAEGRPCAWPTANGGAT